MALKSDITIDATKFDPASISEQTAKLNDHLIKIFENAPKWYEVGAPKYREMRMNGETALPAPKLLPEALEITVPSREAGRDIPCRLIYPISRKNSEERRKCKGTVLHIHGGGWVLGDHKSYDNLLEFYANVGDLAVISVGYRLAPEDPFPKGPEDCIDAGDYLVQHSEKEYGGPLRFIGGESAGAHLSLLVSFHLLKAQTHRHLAPPNLLLHFGLYDMSLLPSVQNFSKSLILDHNIMTEFEKAFLPNKTPAEKKHPSISPYYEDLSPFRGRLPRAFFTCGTEDPLLDDSVNMATKWMMSGGEAIIKIYPGAFHGFISFAPDVLEEAGRALGDTEAFIRMCMA